MSDPKLQEYMDQTVTAFSEAQNEIADALSRIYAQLYGIESAQRVQLLALRRYVIKGGHEVAQGWPWNSEQMKEHKPDTDKMNAAAAATIANFATQNPGLKLGRSKVRDLPKQVQLWCENDTVLRASAHLLPLALRELAKPEYPEIPTDKAPIESFKKFLRDYNPKPKVTSAAPGTSDHGQDRAVDFVVMRNGVTIAGTTTSKRKTDAKSRIETDWEDTGYTKALKKATTGTGLNGPLPNPYEPWHYWLAKAAASSAPKGHGH